MVTAGPPTNWAGNVTFRTRRLHRPESVPELQSLVAGSGRARALGTGHSFSTIADTTGDLISVASLPPVVDIDSATGRVRVAAGVRYGELAVRLDQAGWALPNLGSLPHISVAGACATGTHGSGDANGSLATAVSAVDLMTADGDVLSLSRDRDGDEFRGSVVGLGALGIVTGLTLDLVPAFEISQYVYDYLPRDRLTERFDEIFASGYSVSVFTDWGGSGICQAWLKLRAAAAEPAAGEPAAGDNPPPPDWMGALAADGPRHPVPGMPPGYCTEQLGVPGPWHQRLPHFRLEFTPSAGQELQSEYLVPRDRAAHALLAIEEIRARLAPVLQISEIRTVAADDLWLSMAYRRDCAAIHFTWIADQAAVMPVLAAIEDRLAPLEARPHWGKLFTTGPDILRGLYPRLPEFGRLRRRLDPAGKFCNEFTDRFAPAG